MILYVYNADLQDNTYQGVLIAQGAYYEIQKGEGFKDSSSLISDIVAEKAIISTSNSENGHILDINKAINYLKDIDPSPRDSDGSPLQRTKVTTTGWHYQLHGFEFETAKLDSIYSKKADGSDYNFTSIKFYKLDNGEEVEITGEDLNQTFLDSNCVKTIVDWEPTHDIELVGGILQQKSIPSEDIRLWVIGVPDVPEIYGGSKLFVANANLAFMGIEEGIKADGRAPKYLTYSAQNHTTKMRIVLRHPAGLKHKLHMIFELFKA